MTAGGLRRLSSAALLLAWSGALYGARIAEVSTVRPEATVDLRTEEGARLVKACIAGARERGYRKLRLWTNDVLVSARRIYQAQGFQLVGQDSHHSFGKNLTAQTWELRLDARTGKA